MTDTAAEVLIDPVVRRSPIMAVVTLSSVDVAVPLAAALARGGVGAIEVTLRTPAGLESIRRIASELPDACVGAGTCLSPADLEAAKDAGAAFAVSPGLSPELMRAAAELKLAYLPGVATASEVMQAMAHGHRTLKFFPAVPAGGAPLLRAWAGPFPGVRFCPTGGVSRANAADFLALGNVACVGGSWLVPDALGLDSDWDRVAAEAAASIASLGAVRA